MLEPITVTRVVATPDALASITTPPDAIVMTTSPDEALVVGAAPADVSVADRHAIVVEDPGWAAVWLDTAAADRILSRGAQWRPPEARPTLAQGMLMHLPVKMWVTHDRVLLMASHTVAEDLAQRIGAVL